MRPSGGPVVDTADHELPVRITRRGLDVFLTCVAGTLRARYLNPVAAGRTSPPELLDMLVDHSLSTLSVALSEEDHLCVERLTDVLAQCFRELDAK